MTGAGAATTYKPVDTLHLWYLAQPSRPLSGQALGFQQMRVGEQEADSTLANALSMSRMFALTKDQAVTEVRTVAGIVDGWQEHFSRCGVTKGDIDLYAQHIDRPFLKDQRDEVRR